MKKNRFIWSMLTLSVLALLLVSCKGDPNNSGSTNGSGTVDDNVIYSSYVNTSLILGKDIDERDVSIIKTAYYKNVGEEIAVSSGESATAHEIIIGETDRELSEKAYRVLSRVKEEEDFIGYVIYSDGKSVAVAFDEASFGEAVAFNEAIECFVKKYMQNSSLKLDSGIVYYDSFDAIEKQSERDAASEDDFWNLKLSQISAKINDEEKAEAIVKELKNLKFIYNRDQQIVQWIANLYDPVTGGFYYSNSARNTERYLPDLESTSQALGIVESILTGYGGTLTDYFGEEIASKFVSFVKDMQKPNGYFYHPQWYPEDIDKNEIRKEKDALAALNILELFGASPTYDIFGISGDGIVSPTSSLVTPLRESRVSAVSRVVSTSGSETYIPSHLKSRKAFENYLSTLKLRSDTEAVCKTLYSEIPLYLRIDEILEENGEAYRLSQILENFLTQNQNSTTGLWTSSNDITYEKIGELSSVVKLYNTIGKTIPCYDTIFTTIKTALMFEEEPDTVTDIASVWSALASVVNNITSYSAEITNDQINRSLSEIYHDFDEILKTTQKNLILFLREDGSFSTTPTGSASELFTMNVAVPFAEEGDINATLLAVKNIYLSVFIVLDEGVVPIFSTSDRMMFQKTLLDMGVIIKNEIKKTEPKDFEEFEIGSASDVEYTLYSENCFTEVIAGPEEYGNVLKLYTSKPKSIEEFRFGVMSNLSRAGCFTYELDMCVNEGTSSGKFAWIGIADAHLITLSRKDDTISFYEDSSKSESYSHTRDLGVRVKVGEWFHIRVEYYSGTANTVRIKIYFSSETVDNKCIAVTDNYFGNYKDNSVPNQEYTYFIVYGKIDKITDMLVDNVITEKTYQTYTPEASSDIKMNVDTPDKSQKIHDFTNTAVGSTPSGFTANNPAGVVVTEDADGNKLLAVSEQAGKIILPLDQRGSGANSAVIEFDLTVPVDSTAGAKYQINFNEYLYNERNFGGIQLLVVEENKNKYLTLAEVFSGKTGTIYDNVKLSLGVNHRLRFQLFFEQDAIVVFANGELVGVNSNVLAGCKKYYMGETTIEALTPGKTSTVLIDNLVSERIRSDFAEATAPDIDRVNHGFDTADGLDAYGVTIAGGVLSFENATGNEAYVQIPVNARVDLPTISLAGLTVTRIDRASGDIIISFRDKTGENIIAAFLLENDGSAVNIYEYTENGNRHAPIYTVEESLFNIAIEYSAAKERFNILVNDKYVAASALTYTHSSGSFDFEKLRVSSIGGSAGFVIDDLYAEEIIGSFGIHEVAIKNTDETDSIMTYETSSFASMPWTIEQAFTSTKTYLRICEGVVVEKVSKVLEFYASGEATEAIVVNRTQTLPGANAAFFETDIMLSALDTKAQLYLEFGSRDGYVYTFVIEAPSTGAQLRALGAKDAKDFDKELDVKEGEWFSLRIEYADTPYDFDYDGKSDCVFRAYVNGDLIGEGHTLNNYTKPMQSASAIDRIRLRINEKVTCSAYLDNTALGQCDITYDAPMEADKETLTFEQGIITYMTQFTFGKATSTSQISEMTVNGEITKVLNFHTANGSADKLSVSATQLLEAANAISFETDLMIDPAVGTSVFYLEPETADNKYPFRLTIKATAGGNVTISADDIVETVIGKCGEWIHLRIEYMNPTLDYTGDGAADILYKIYVGDSEEALVGHKVYSSSSYFNPLYLTKYVLVSPSASEADIYLDNMEFWQVELTPDVPDVFPDSGEDNYHGHTGTEGGGWTIPK